MLVALLLIFLGSLLGGGSLEIMLLSKQTRKQVKTVMVEKAQAKAVIKQMDLMQDAVSKAGKGLRKDLKQWAKSDKDHTVGRKSLGPIVAKSMTGRGEARKDFLDALFVMKSKMTQDQWNAVFAEQK